MKKIAVIFGTRPEAIKLCPVILALRDHPLITTEVCVTAQHREMLDQVLHVFGVTPEVDLELMTEDQTLSGLSSKAIRRIGLYLKERKPDMVLVQGDTSTTFCAALSAYYEKVPIGHVEAGLRTHNKYSPFPEEINRVLTTRLSDLHFAPTNWAKQNLIDEGVEEQSITVTGNPVIDALLHAKQLIAKAPPSVGGIPSDLQPGSASGRRLVLVTSHRRENFGEGLSNICAAIKQLAQSHPDIGFVYPVHPNPNVRMPVTNLIGNGKYSNIYLIEPLDYLCFVALVWQATLVLTDSGGVQEEAPSLGKPVLVMRDSTERPEALEAGTSRLVGTDRARIVQSVAQLLSDDAAYQLMARAKNPYGDGRAAERILEACMEYLCERPH